MVWNPGSSVEAGLFITQKVQPVCIISSCIQHILLIFYWKHKHTFMYRKINILLWVMLLTLCFPDYISGGSEMICIKDQGVCTLGFIVKWCLCNSILLLDLSRDNQHHLVVSRLTPWCLHYFYNNCQMTKYMLVTMHRLVAVLVQSSVHFFKVGHHVINWGECTYIQGLDKIWKNLRCESDNIFSIESRSDATWDNRLHELQTYEEHYRHTKLDPYFSFSWDKYTL